MAAPSQHGEGVKLDVSFWRFYFRQLISTFIIIWSLGVKLLKFIGNCQMCRPIAELKASTCIPTKLFLLRSVNFVALPQVRHCYNSPTPRVVIAELTATCKKKLNRCQWALRIDLSLLKADEL